MPKPLIQTTGRRKQAVARVRLRPGSGVITVNRRPLEDYFPSETHRMLLIEPLRVSNTADVYDVDATLDGGGVSGQAGALRMGIARALVELDPEVRPSLKKAGFLTRDAREKESKKYGPQGAPVLQAVAAVAPVLRFGTDGVRGVANVDLTPELVVALGRAAARAFAVQSFAVGRDTRRSGPLLQAALTAGLTSEGVDVVDLGVVPTPVVAHAAAEAGAMISASHNPFPDNGIKFFSAGGRKLTDEAEAVLEAELDHVLAATRAAVVDGPAAALDAGGTAVPTGAAVGSVRTTGLPPSYVETVCGSIDGRRLDGLRLVIDCANGAATTVAPDVLRQLGAAVEVIHADPDGTNINERCGSTDPRDLQRAVVAAGADAGLAFDGDADRVIAVDAAGALVDGDQIIAVCAVDRAARAQLPERTVVVTVMANLGFRLAMEAHGITVVETQVGDRYVLEAMERGGWCLGGEQSGHVIFRDVATTGDGLLTGVQLLDVVARTGRTLAESAAVMERLPQVLRNVRVADRDVDVVGAISQDVAEIERELAGRGRVLVRPSGTEPLVRVMVEAPSPEQAAAAADRLVAAVTATAGRAAGEG